MPADDSTYLLLGEIKGKLEMIIINQNATHEKIDHLGSRLNHVESKSAQYGLITGAVAAVAISLVKEKLGI